VADIYEIEVDDMGLKGKQKKRVKARSLFCYYKVGEFRNSLTDLGRRLGIRVAGVG
jgi:chromosomal replication initiation ATPase DnaA